MISPQKNLVFQYVAFGIRDMNWIETALVCGDMNPQNILKPETHSFTELRMGAKDREIEESISDFQFLSFSYVNYH